MKHSVTRFFRDTRLTQFYPMPKAVMNMGLPSTAVLLYTILLHRGGSSQINGFTDEAGWVYVVYPVADIAKDMGLKRKSIQTNLSALEQAGLIVRKRPVGNKASHIYLNIPAESERIPSTPPFAPPGVQKKTYPATPKGATSNNTKINNKKISDYLYDEEESL